jgi:hypothetical protein
MPKKGLKLVSPPAAVLSFVAISVTIFWRSAFATRFAPVHCPLSRSLSAGLGHGAICAQPPLRPMAYKPVARGGTLKIQIQRKRTITRLRPSGFHRARARGDVVDAFRFTDRLSEDGRRLLWARRSVNQGPQMDAGSDRAQKVRQPF